MITIAVMNQKGGVGKTTLTRNLGECLASCFGKKVLLADLDPQANLTLSMNVRHFSEEEDRDEFSVNKEDLEVDFCLADMFDENYFKAFALREGLDLLPNELSFASMESSLMTRYGREMILRNILALGEQEKQYDICLLDCPPSLGQITVNGLAAADYLLIPVKPSEFSLVGLRYMLQFIAKIRPEINKNLKVLGLVFNGFDSRRIEAQVSRKRIERKHPDLHIFDAAIRISEKYAQAERRHESIFEGKNTLELSEEVKALSQEILTRINS